MLSPEQQELTEAWSAEIQQTAVLIASAELELKEARTQANKKKHTLDELKSKLRELCEDGPFPDEDKEPGLFDGMDDGQDTVRVLRVPQRLHNALEKAGITKLSQLRAVLQGVHPEFPNGLDDIAGLDPDAKNRLRSEFLDEDDDEDDEPDTVAVDAPVELVVDAMPLNVYSPKPDPVEDEEEDDEDEDDSVVVDDSDSEKVYILLKTDSLREAGYGRSSSVDAIIEESGQAIVTIDGADYMLEAGEFEIDPLRVGDKA